MATGTDNATRDLVELEGIGPPGNIVVHQVAAGVQIFKGTMLSFAADWGLCPASDTHADPDSYVVGVALHGTDNRLGEVGDRNIRFETDRVFAVMNATGVRIGLPIGVPMGVSSDHSVAPINEDETIVGYYYGMHDDGRVRVMITGKAKQFPAAPEPA